MVNRIKVEFNGLDKLQAKLLKAIQLKEVERIIEDNGVAMQKKAIRNAENFRGHYEGWGKKKRFVKPTGATKRSISFSSGKLGRFKYRVMPGTEYAAYVELGTRKMSAQPFIGPAYMDQVNQFKKDMSDLVK
ncbi:HK97-gp10 family putative phage morphogenesis protein [Streptococcus hillyeri]|uniref:HK97-gp10 family putative phage morphogenesis protein n=1 Tax=Streptococcus hillyeri TaxID=2282420 RepID=UPI001C7D84ED|nr:HK97-gp10 family putative phage morphogenesis protein [Streptococcus hillyeri]